MSGAGILQRAIIVADELTKRLGKAYPDLCIKSITGAMPEEERREKVEEIGTHSRRVLVATDCLSEGVNLQDSFDAVVHYDLPWNPNRLEQREGRVDRFGQQKTERESSSLLWAGQSRGWCGA